MSTSPQISTDRPGKISQGTEGLGTVTPEMVEARARELALADGRREPNDKDFLSARDELVPSGFEPVPPEIDSPEVENVTEWNSAPSESGHAVPVVRPEDDANIGEELVNEGLDEADHATRVAAAHASPPEEE